MPLPAACNAWKIFDDLDGGERSMNRKLTSLMLAVASVLLLTNQPNFGQDETKQVSQKPSKNYLAVIFNNRLGRDKGCLPAEVMSIGQGGAPPEGIEVVIKNFEVKIIRAVKLGWYIIEDPDRMLPGRMLRTPCDAPPFPDKVILSGQTPLIELGVLYPNETCAIGKKPLKLFTAGTFFADKVFLMDEHPFTLEMVKELTTDGTSKTFKKQYSMLIAVSEIHYDDGSAWKLKEAPPPFAPAPK
jgi:hypothetical protein